MSNRMLLAVLISVVAATDSSAVKGFAQTAAGAPQPARQAAAAQATPQAGSQAAQPRAKKQQAKPQQAQAQQAAQPQATPTSAMQQAIASEANKYARHMKDKLGWDGVPSNLFQQYAGRWEGNFWVYSPMGRKKQAQKIVVEYAPQPNGTMIMKSMYLDLVSKQWAVAENATYMINGDQVIVDIKRPKGRVDRQTGHYSDGQLFLLSKISDGVEHYRERFKNNDELLIDGFGVYTSSKGEDQNVFIGRLRRKR